jgi:hypothetical protein
MKGAPTIKSGQNFLGTPDADAQQSTKIWQPKSKGRPNKRVAK